MRDVEKGGRPKPIRKKALLIFSHLLVLPSPTLKKTFISHDAWGLAAFAHIQHYPCLSFASLFPPTFLFCWLLHCYIFLGTFPAPTVQTTEMGPRQLGLVPFQDFPFLWMATGLSWLSPPLPAFTIICLCCFFSRVSAVSGKPGREREREAQSGAAQPAALAESFYSVIGKQPLQLKLGEAEAATQRPYPLGPVLMAGGASRHYSSVPST